MTAFGNKPFEKKMDNNHKLRILGGGKDNPSGLADFADAALKKARLRLHRAFERLGQADPGPAALALLGTYFFLDRSRDGFIESLNEIKRIMELVKNGLQSDITLKVGPSIKSKNGIGDSNGAVNIIQHQSMESAERTVEQKRRAGKTWYNAVANGAGGHYSLATGAMKISTSRLMQDLGVKTLLHEASHKYAGTLDEWYYRDSAPNEVILIAGKDSPVDHNKSLSPVATKRAMRNADSFAWFIYLLGAE